MPLVKNVSRGGRIVQERFGKDEVRPRLLNPGESAEIDVFNPDDVVFRAMVDSGELELDGGKHSERAKAQGEVVDLRKQLAEAQAKINRLEEERNVDRFENDPNFRDTRQAAMIAGASPGFVDIDPDRDPEELEESRKGGSDRQAGVAAQTVKQAPKAPPAPASTAKSPKADDRK